MIAIPGIDRYGWNFVLLDSICSLLSLDAMYPHVTYLYDRERTSALTKLYTLCHKVALLVRTFQPVAGADAVALVSRAWT
jgi:hypothetical protein